MTTGLDPVWVATNCVVDGHRPERAVFDSFIGTGQMSRNVRFRLEWEPGIDGPASVVVKLPSEDPGTRAISFEHGVYRKECDFYRSIASIVDVAAPSALAVHFDDDAQDFAIILEDLADSVQGDQFTEPTHEQLLAAVRQAAALHAPVWGDAANPALASFREDSEQRAGLTGALIPAFLPAVFERLGPGLTPDVRALLERFGPLAGPWSMMRGEPTTLFHGDFRPDNFMFGATESAPPLVVVDWQTLSLGLGVCDIAYLLGAAVTPERRREIEDDMLDYYRAELARRGVDYSAEQCWSEYAIGSLHGVVIAISATSMAEQTERGDALFTLMLNRHGQHALDLDVLDRVRPLPGTSKGPHDHHR